MTATTGGGARLKPNKYIAEVVVTMVVIIVELRGIWELSGSYFRLTVYTIHDYFLNGVVEFIHGPRKGLFRT